MTHASISVTWPKPSVVEVNQVSFNATGQRIVKINIDIVEHNIKERLQTPVRQAFSSEIRHIFDVIHWTMSCSKQWKHAVSRMKMPVVREPATSLIKCHIGYTILHTFIMHWIAPQTFYRTMPYITPRKVLFNPHIVWLIYFFYTHTIQ